MATETKQENGALVIRPEGKLDGTNSRAFHAEMDEITQGDDNPTVVLDLENVSYVSSAALRVILLVAKGMGRNDRKFALSSLSTEVMEVFSVSGFDQIIEVYDNAQEATLAISPKANS